MSNGIISALGAGSGIDTSSLVTQLVEIERLPQEQSLDRRQETLEAQISAYGLLTSSLSELQSFVDILSDNDLFNSRSVAFTDSTAITPNFVEPGAQTGTYQIDVIEVAQAQSLASGAFSDPDASLNASGTLTFSFGGYDDVDPDLFTVNEDRAALNIEVNDGDSLNDLADRINEADSGIQASVLLVDGQSQLLITAPSGESNALRVTSDGVNLEQFEFNESNRALLETQQGQDAELTVNGLTVFRETNQIDDVIQGLDFSLNRADEGNPVTFTIEPDTLTPETAIRDFVEAYNAFYEVAQNLTGFSEDPETNETVRGDLATDGAAGVLIDRLRSEVVSSVTGVEDGFNALTNIGIRTNRVDGSLEIVEDDFSRAFEENFDLVESLFASNITSSSNEIRVSEGSSIANAVPGEFEVVVTTNPERASLATGVTSLDFSSPPLVIADGDESYGFSLTVDGIESEDIFLSGTFNSEAEIASALQSLINGDTNLDAAGVSVNVRFNDTTSQFEFTSRSYGSDSEIDFSSASTYGANASLLGFGADFRDTGVDVVGSIGGQSAFGVGNVLLPSLDTDQFGLNFTIGENAVEAGSVTASFSRGLAGQLSSLIDDFLSSSGIIQTRENNINNALDEISTDREALEVRLENFEARLVSQFIASEAIIAGLQNVGDQLDGIIDRLPFTASNN